MDTTITWLVILLLTLVSSAFRDERNLQQPGRILARRFNSLGSLDGLTQQEIIRRVGMPDIVDASKDGQLLKWVSTDFSVTLRFDEKGKFKEIASESMA